MFDDAGKPTPAARLLVVDNEMVVRRLLAMYLQHSGYTCDVASSGDEALAKVSADPASYSVVITDLEMPDMDGLTLAQALRKQFPSLKVLIVSGTDIPPSLKVLREMGSTAFLHKPVTKATLAAAVQALVECYA